MNDKSFGAMMEEFRKAGEFTPEMVNIGGIPVSILMVVDFPAPLAPIKPKICPLGTSKVKSLTA